MSVENALLHNQIIDYADSECEYEAMLGQLLLQRCNELDGEPLLFALRETLDGLERVIKQFDDEWKTIR